jgi:RhoGAP domain
MLKAWLRELPDEIFPKASQDRVARECAGAVEVPQLLVDELSNLPPFNYYLLFAITCHLSLLLAHSDKNKMDFRNLCICFQPCMRIDAFCFKFLVVDWRDCWKGCNTEDEWIAKEYSLFDALPPSSGEGHGSTAVESHDERNVSSSDSSKPSSVSLENAASAKVSSRSRSPNIPLAQSENGIRSSDGSSTITTLTVKENRQPRNAGEMKPLSPIQPLSPMQL